MRWRENKLIIRATKAVHRQSDSESKFRFFFEDNDDVWNNAEPINPLL